MQNPDRDTPSATRGNPPRVARDPADEWQATRILANVASETPRHVEPQAAEGNGDIGRKTSPNEHELFVSCDPGPALQQQFDFLAPVYIAVHDIETTSSRKLLHGIATAGGRSMQRLVIRRQGYGTALATLHFVELQTNEGPLLRMYTTDCETEAGWRAEIAHLLLSYSRLAVVMVGNLQAQAIGAALQPLRERMTSGPWPNRHLLLLPLSSANTLVSHGMELARGTPVNVRTTPQVARPADAWGFISGSWARANDKSPRPEHSTAALSPLFANGRRAVGGAAANARSADAEHAESADTAPGVLALSGGGASERPVAKPGAAPAIVSGTRSTSAANIAAQVAANVPLPLDLLRRYVRQISEISGVGSCCVFDQASASSIAYAGTGPGAAVLAVQGAALMGNIVNQGRALNLGDTMSEAAITLSQHHLLLRAIPQLAGLGMIAVLERAATNLTLVRLQVLRMDTLFEDVLQ